MPQIKMKPPRSRRVQAQRKFAQGAYVPPNVVPVAANNTERREPLEARNNVIYNRCCATNLLDSVAFQGLHHHLQPRVLIERLGRNINRVRERERNLNRDRIINNDRHRDRGRDPAQTREPGAQKTIKHCKEQKRVHAMSLRSKRLSKLQRRKSNQTKIIVPRGAKTQPRPKKKCAKDHDASSEFTLDDNRPLKYLKYSSTPKRPAISPAKKTVTAPPEPIAGPSGFSSVRRPYYSERNIHRWMNDSLTPEPPTPHEFVVTAEVISIKSENDEPAICPAHRWLSIKDVADAPTSEMDGRCTTCAPCLRINKLIKLSTLFSSHNFAETSATNDGMVSSDGDHYIYMEMLPKHPDLMFRIRSNNNRGKEMLAVSLIRRNCAKENATEEFLLEEQEHLLDQLIETVTPSLNENRPRAMSPVRNDDNANSPPAKIAKIKNTSVKKSLKNKKAKEHTSLAKRRSRIEPEPEEQEPERDKQAGTDAMQSEVIRAQTALIIRSKLVDETRQKAAEAEAQMLADMETLANVLEKETNAKEQYDGRSSINDPIGPGCSTFVESTIVDAPTFQLTKEEFNDPISFFERIWPEARKYGICKVIPPKGWKPTCKVKDEMTFDVCNQYISRMYSRWGPAARELCAIKLCLQQQNVKFTHPPLLDGVEVNLPKLYHTVQRLGGLENILNKKRWGKVAEEMKFSKTPTTERKLDQIYVKYLLPYDTLAHQERQEIMRKVEKAWSRRNQKLLDRALNPLYRQKRMLGESESSDDDSDDDATGDALAQAEDCIIPGNLISLAKFKKIAANAYDNHFGHCSERAESISAAEIEHEYWQHVLLATEHVCVNTAYVHTGSEGFGFTKHKNEPLGRHPWNLKNFSVNTRNILRYLGPVLGVTVPTLHLSMLYSTSCWHKDPHKLGWTEYMHHGAEKIWYGIPEAQTDNFRRAVETLTPTACQNKWLWLATDIAMIPPSVLKGHNVSLSKTIQGPNEFVIVCPNAYSCSVSTGYSVSESVYFAPLSWLSSLLEVFQEISKSCEPTMFSLERFLLLMGQDQRADKDHLKIIQPRLDKMLRDEVNRRLVLQERGLKFTHEYNQQRNKRRSTPQGAWNVRDHDECEYCRTTLYLSKVRGLPTRRSFLCLEHAVKLLDTNLYNSNVAQMEVFVYVSVMELNSVADSVKARLDTPDS